MRLPNGYGSVVKLPGSRRKPYAARVTVGWKNGRQVRKYIGYYTKKEDAVNALATFNLNPYDLDANTMTFKDVWEHWYDSNFEQGSKSAQSAWKTGYKHCEPIYNMKMKDIKLVHLEKLLVNKGVSTQGQIKNICVKMFTYAIKHEWITRNPTTYMELGKAKRAEKIPFTEQEISELWERSKDDEYLELILVLLYTGMRVSELLEMEQANVHEDYMIGGVKTEAGRDRIIPIHTRIRPFIQKRLDGSQYLLHNDKGRKLSYTQFRYPFTKKIKGHTIHETRHTFISRMHSIGVNDVTLKIIVGHSHSDVTSKVYIHKNKDELIKEVEKLT